MPPAKYNIMVYHVNTGRNEIMKDSIVTAEDVVNFMKQEKKEKQETYMHFRMSESMVKMVNERADEFGMKTSAYVKMLIKKDCGMLDDDV
jgi:predicted DNA binding CopG/RHH family protein